MAPSNRDALREYLAGAKLVEPNTPPELLDGWHIAVHLPPGDYREVALGAFADWRCLLTYQRDGHDVEELLQATSFPSASFLAALGSGDRDGAARWASIMGVAAGRAHERIATAWAREQAEKSLRGVTAMQARRARKDAPRIAERGRRLPDLLRELRKEHPGKKHNTELARAICKRWGADAPGVETVRKWLTAHRRELEESWEPLLAIPELSGQLGPALPHGAANGAQNHDQSVQRSRTGRAFSPDEGGDAPHQPKPRIAAKNGERQPLSSPDAAGT